ncbi:hypothetical protein Pint_23898 [Pistacia integerrima]|uniref:Uncharacterized protein n=1 Tax=Pistacia integerrima TaxID=434235 RepID=A0ACC0YJ16_9ROSI|nr:hypothetical protein Pint_23898 [Pistacia integerrima]
MTQKGNLFKGKQKKKVIPPNRHGKAVQIRKGKRVVKPSKITRDMDTDRGYSYFVQISGFSRRWDKLMIIHLADDVCGFFIKVMVFCEEFLLQIWWMGLSFFILLSAFWTFKELTKFINHCNEVKAATLANKEGGQLSIVKTSAGSTANKKDEKPGSD